MLLKKNAKTSANDIKAYVKGLNEVLKINGLEVNVESAAINIGVKRNPITLSFPLGVDGSCENPHIAYDPSCSIKGYDTFGKIGNSVGAFNESIANECYDRYLSTTKMILTPAGSNGDGKTLGRALHFGIVGNTQSNAFNSNDLFEVLKKGLYILRYIQVNKLYKEVK